MAKILHFARLAADQRRRLPDAPCEVVIFPGIRVEYHDVPPQHPTGKGGARRRRRGSAKRALGG